MVIAFGLLTGRQIAILNELLLRATNAKQLVVRAMVVDYLW